MKSCEYALPPNVLLGPQYPWIFSDTNIRIKGAFLRLILGKLFPPEAKIKLNSIRVFAPLALIRKINALYPGRQVLSELERLTPLSTNENWMTVGRGHPPDWLENAISSISANEKHPVMFCSAEVEGINAGPKSPIAERWMEIARSPLIPFDLRKRKILEDYAQEVVAKVLHARRAMILSKKSQKQTPMMKWTKAKVQFEKWDLSEPTMRRLLCYSLRAPLLELNSISDRTMKS